MGYCTNSAYSGKLVHLYYFLGCQDVEPDPEDYTYVGWRRDLAFNVDISDSDATTAGTPGAIRTYIQTFKEITGDFSGISNRDAALKALRTYLMTQTETPGWVKLVIPDEAGSVEVIQVQCIFTTYAFNSGYEDPATNDVSWKAVAVPLFDDVPSFNLTLTPATVSFVQGVGGTSDVTASGGVSAEAFVTSSSADLTATINNATGEITLASTTPGSYTVDVVSAVNQSVSEMLTVTVTAS